MTSTPSRTPSRSHTPSPSPRPASRASTPQPRYPRTRTISQATLTAVPPRLHVTAVTSTAVSSPTSSISNVDLSEGVILRDPDGEEADVAESEEQVEGVFAESKEDGEERKRILRDHLRRSLTHKDTKSSLRQTQKGSSALDINEVPYSPGRWSGSGSRIIPAGSKLRHDRPNRSVFPNTELFASAGEQFPQRQYFVFTDAGKPVFVSRPPSATEDLATITGITSALISVFADSTLSPPPYPSSTPDKLRCINAGSTRITFFLRSPLYYVCVSKWKEPESVARMHLEYLHNQILSVLTASQLRRIFERRTNFDLRRLLEGTETFLHTLISRLQTSLALPTTLSALSSLRLDPSIRNRVGDALVPSSKSGGGLDILYALLISGDSVVTLVRPRKHSVHPTDINILLNALHTPSVAANPVSWLPICLPKFNPQGFVHAYVCFLEHEPLEQSQAPATTGLAATNVASTASNTDGNSTLSAGSSSTPASDTESRLGSDSPHHEPLAEADRAEHRNSDGDLEENKSTGRTTNESLGYKGGPVLVTVSGGGDFDAVKTWSDGVVKVLDTKGIMPSLRTAVQAAPYECSELGIPGIRHFLYKSRVHVQVTSPKWDDEYQSLDDQRRLITIYQTVHDAIHAKSGQGTTLKLQYIRTEKEAVLGWITQPFELYVALSPRLPKSAAVGAANAVARWAKREEAKLFLRDAPVF